ncbi:hypothetical protein, partial [Sphingomonas sp. PP-CE-1G-424]|uniref:hypothetical protein n=1 Tax=Sphingomonas sp. PP-CE-1G-424 TaxID=2135658 RepID=UPI0010CFDEFE
PACGLIAVHHNQPHLGRLRPPEVHLETSMTVIFNHAHSVGAHYNKDDVAKFDTDVEKDLVDRKIANKHTPAKAGEKTAA